MMKGNAEIDGIRLQRVTKNLLEAVKFSVEQQNQINLIKEKATSGPKALTSRVESSVKKQPVDSNLGTSREKQVSAEQASLPKKNFQAKPRAAIVAWDLGHNPAGRALVLYRLLERDYSVDLIGPIWSRYGKAIWQPLKSLGLNVRSFLCSDIIDFTPKAEFVAHEKMYDLVYVSKPRLPSLFIGKLISLNSQCPLIIDVDDFELSFFKNESYADIEEVMKNPRDTLREPYEELATRYCQNLVSAADAVTVSNIALKRKFGGQLVRHARDESDYRNFAVMRESGRQRLNVTDDAFLLLFVGTPRPHKGILEVAKAIYEINDPHIVFHVVGTISDQGFKNALKMYECPQIVFHGNCDFSLLPELIAAADLVPLIQDTNHPISNYQIPAKISDATSMGVPVLATRTPPIEDMILTGGIIETTLLDLKDNISQCANKQNEYDRNNIRGFFNDELGTSVNRSRLRMVISDINNEGSSYSDTLGEMVRLVRNTYASIRSEAIQFEQKQQEETADSTIKLNTSAFQNKKVHRFTGRKRTAGYKLVKHSSDRPGGIGRLKAILSENFKLREILKFKGNYDIAYFWKQNDTGLYGRRSDMLAKYLANSGRVRTLVQFDAPVETKQIKQYLSQVDERFLTDQLSQQELVLRNLYDRQMNLSDSRNRVQRTYISPHPKASCSVGTENIAERSYANYVKEVLLENGMRPETTVAWFCPVVWDAPKLISELNFGAVISDLIDDQRAWSVGNKIYYKKLEVSYGELLSKSDLVFSNCDSLANTFLERTDEVHVVPNAAECLLDRSKNIQPRFKSIDKPIIGYVGNLRDRIDWILLHKVVAELDDFHFVFIGPDSDSKNAQSLAKHANVDLLGVVPYDEMVNYLGEFSAAIVPHLNNQLTAKMNPLKVYNYIAAGLPVVSTEIANLPEIGRGLVVASTTDKFVNALKDAVENPLDTKSKEWSDVVRSISWADRVDTILDIMDVSLDGSLSSSITRQVLNT